MIAKTIHTIPLNNCQILEARPLITQLKRFFLVWVFPTNASYFFILYIPDKINATPITISTTFKPILFTSTYYVYLEFFSQSFFSCSTYEQHSPMISKKFIITSYDFIIIFKR